MKKMVCEICGSVSIRKENGVFVCKECGTEYSVDDAKKLLQEVEEENSAPVNEEKKVTENTEAPVSEPVPSAQEETSSSLPAPASQDEKLRLEYDLLCWHNFHKKCHELEKSFYIQDDNYGNGMDVCTRILSYDYENYYRSLKLDETFHNHYMSSHPEFREEYDKENEAKNKARPKPLIPENRTLSYIFLGLAGVLLFVVIILSLTSDTDNFPIAAVLIMTPLALIATLFGIVFQKGLYRNSEEEAKAASTIYLTWDTYVQKVIMTSPEYIAAKKQFHDKAISKMAGDATKMYDGVHSLKKVRAEMTEKINISSNYTDEEHINGMLALVLDGRADTLKEAMNLYETEKYRNTVISYLNIINMNLTILNQNIYQLRSQLNTTNAILSAGLRAALIQNNAICTELECMNFTATVFAVNSLWA